VGTLEPAGVLEASWIDPVTGEALEIGTVANTGGERFSAPADWEDALLLLETH
jgi:hypothetical protein